MATSNVPAIRFRSIVEGKASEFLSTTLGTQSGQEAAGKVALAFRSAAQANDKLYGCDPASVAQAIAMSAMTGLMPGGPLPDVYLLPRGNQLQWFVSHRGYLKLMSRTGTRIRARFVLEGERFEVAEGLNPDIVHVPDLELEPTWDNLKAVYVVAHYPDGNSDFVVVRKKDIEKRRNNSDAWKRNSKRSPWGQWPVEMALKTGIRYAISRGLVYLDEKSSQAFEQDGVQDAPAADTPNVIIGNEASTGMGALSESVKELTDNTPDTNEAVASSLVDAVDIAATQTADI
jgi:phage RecT family recombinase